MRRYTFIIAALYASILANAQSLTTRIDVLLGDALLHTADASVAVYDLTADRMLYEHRADKLCRPASVEKVITTVAALNRLGTDYTLHTELRATEFRRLFPPLLERGPYADREGDPKGSRRSLCRLGSGDHPERTGLGGRNTHPGPRYLSISCSKPREKGNVAGL